jgi:hypothetical protein
MEIKNRYNTDNSSSRITKYSKLAKYKASHPEYTAIYGVINDMPDDGKYRNIVQDNQQIKYISGFLFLRYVFGEDMECILNFARQLVEQLVSRVLCPSVEIEDTDTLDKI